MNILILDVVYLIMFCLFKILGDLKYMFVLIFVKENFCVFFLYFLKNFILSVKESNCYLYVFES